MTRTQVLLVEDEPSYARLLEEVLREGRGLEAQVRVVGSLAQALEALGAASFDIVLLDLGLPDAEGTEALTRIAAHSQTTPIVVLSALSDLDVAVASMRLGAQDYLVKGEGEHLLLPRAIRYAIERKRLEEGLIVARAEAERASAVKDEFLAMLGHELRNPLAPIVTAISLMRQRGPAGLERQLAVVDRQVQHVVHLVDDLLDVSRIARGKLELRRSDVDLADAISDAIEIARPLIESRRHELEVDAPRSSSFVNGDRARLSQVIANLLTNAAKYTNPAGKIVVRLNQEGARCRLSVRDNGAGMTRELLARAFDLFEQGSQTLERAAGGLGLGLSIVKSLTALHGGTVEAISEGVGLGTEFVVWLPLHAPQRRSATPSRPPLRPSPSPRSVLLVDDNVDSTDMLSFGLRGLGHVVQGVHDGETALTVAQNFRPDVAFIDIGLPGMDGYELARRLRRQLGDPAPLLVALTGYGQDSDRSKARAAGFDSHLVKPVDLVQIAELIAAAPRVSPRAGSAET